VDQGRLATTDALDLAKSRDGLVAKQCLRSLVSEAKDHVLGVFRISECVNRNGLAELVGGMAWPIDGEAAFHTFAGGISG
jgi:hypothetical protein